MSIFFSRNLILMFWHRADDERFMLIKSAVKLNIFACEVSDEAAVQPLASAPSSDIALPHTTSIPSHSPLPASPELELRPRSSSSVSTLVSSLFPALLQDDAIISIDQAVVGSTSAMQSAGACSLSHLETTRTSPVKAWASSDTTTSIATSPPPTPAIPLAVSQGGLDAAAPTLEVWSNFSADIDSSVCLHEPLLGVWMEVRLH